MAICMENAYISPLHLPEKVRRLRSILTFCFKNKEDRRIRTDLCVTLRSPRFALVFMSVLLEREISGDWLVCRNGEGNGQRENLY